MDKWIVLCPLVNMEVDDITCLLMAEYSEGQGCTDPFPDGADAEYADAHPEICMKCKYHPT